MNKRLQNCPVCNSKLEVSRYYCPECDTTIEGRFRLTDFALLNTAQQEFARTFICCQGNIKEVEKKLGISYPTVKNRLQEIRLILCEEDQPQAETGKTLDVLADLESGKISAEEAIELLEKES